MNPLNCQISIIQKRECQLALMYLGRENIVFRVVARNGSDFVGGEAAAVCLQGFMDLENQFNVGDPVRYQVLLSAVKQLTGMNSKY